MILQFEHFIHQHHLFKKDDTILIAVSGGIDSMVLLQLFQVYAKNKIAVAHCNFNLRGKESMQDEVFVVEYCNSNSIDVYSKSFDTTVYAKEQGISIQMAARDLRFNWFQEIAKENNFNKIALAQHLDDQVETFFINLIRGTGISGIHGILPINGDLIRPLLFTDRKEIDKYQTENNIPFREDQSNKSEKYIRNYIRHNISPEFESIAPNFAFKLNENIEHFRDVESFYKSNIERNLSQITIHKGDETIVNLPALKKLGSTKLHIRELLFEKGFNTDTINKVYLLINNPTSGKVFESATHEILFHREQMIIRKKLEKTHSEYLINTDEDIDKPIRLICEQIENNLDSYKTSPDIALFDFNKLVFPLVLRKWKEADSFIPHGMNGRKKLSDLFIDNKLSNFEKDEVWILQSGGDIIWIIGHRVDNRYRVTKKTKTIFKIKQAHGNN